MKRIHVLRTGAGADEVEGLVAAARAEGLRVGWLDLTLEIPPPALDPLDRMAEAGAARAVALDPGRAVSVKHSVGPPVLRDVLREHFVGCALVLVRDAAAGTGDVAETGLDLGELPVLRAAGEGWRVVAPDGEVVALGSAELAGRLRRPEPWPGAYRTDRRSGA